MRFTMPLCFAGAGMAEGAGREGRETENSCVRDSYRVCTSLTVTLAGYESAHEGGQSR